MYINSYQESNMIELSQYCIEKFIKTSVHFKSALIITLLY